MIEPNDLPTLPSERLAKHVVGGGLDAERVLPDLVGIYNIGAGNRGIARALEEAGRTRHVVFIGHELTEHTRRFLLSGIMHAVIDQEPRREAELAVNALLQAIRGTPMQVPVVRPRAIFRENMD